MARHFINERGEVVLDEKAMQRTVKANVRVIMRYLDQLDPVTRREVIEHAATVYQARRVARAITLPEAANRSEEDGIHNVR